MVEEIDRIDPYIREQLRQIVKVIGLQKTLVAAREIEREISYGKGPKEEKPRG